MAPSYWTFYGGPNGPKSPQIGPESVPQYGAGGSQEKQGAPVSTALSYTIPFYRIIVGCFDPLGDPFCGCHCNKSPTVWVFIRAPNFWKWPFHTIRYLLSAKQGAPTDPMTLTSRLLPRKGFSEAIQAEAFAAFRADIPWIIQAMKA